MGIVAETGKNGDTQFYGRGGVTLQQRRMMGQFNLGGGERGSCSRMTNEWMQICFVSVLHKLGQTKGAKRRGKAKKALGGPGRAENGTTIKLRKNERKM